MTEKSSIEIIKRMKNKIDYKKMIEVTPLKNHDLNCPPHFSGVLTEGKKIKIPEFLKSSLITENVIKEK